MKQAAPRAPSRLLGAGALALLALAAAGCESSSDPCADPGACTSGSGVAASSSECGGVQACAGCDAPVSAGEVAVEKLTEASGIAASAFHEGVFYAENDGSRPARFHAIDARGEDAGAFELSGLTAIDIEDIARGPCNGGASCVYLADIGDNDRSRVSYAIYRSLEPATLGESATLGGEVFPFVYPDGSHDAETLLVHPTTGVVTIVTKEGSGAGGIYELPMPLTAGTPATAVKVGAVAPKAGSASFTGGDVHPSGRGVLMRTKSSVFYFDHAETSAAEALSGTPCAMPSPCEPQGEAVGWLIGGDGFVTVSEGTPTTLWSVACEPR